MASCAIAWCAVPSTTSSAKLLIAIAPTFVSRIVFLLRMGLFLSGRPSACRVLSPALLTCLHQFIHARRGPNLENVAVLQSRMLRHKLYSMIHVPRLKDEYAAELFLGFRIGAVRGCDFAVLRMI